MLNYEKFPDNIENELQNNSRMKRNLDVVKFGKPDTPRSWVYENLPADEILAKWSNQLKSLTNRKDLDRIAKWDLDKASKFGPQGGTAPFDERQTTLAEYWEHLSHPDLFDSKEWKQAKDRTVRKLRLYRNSDPISVDRVIELGISRDKYNTNSGYPLYLKRKNPKAIEHAKSAATDGSWKDEYPTLGSRASMGKTGTNARWIFMTSMSSNLAGQRFAIPFQEHLRLLTSKDKYAFFAPWDGWPAVQRWLSNLPVKSSDYLYFGTDFTKMDQHFNISHGMEAFDVIKEFFKPKYWDQLKESIEFIFLTPIITPYGLLKGPHALISGSEWTNLIETVFDLILSDFIEHRYHLKFVWHMAIGDDQLWVLLFKGNVDKLVDLIVATFKEAGMDANSEKQEVARDMISFLQRHSYNFWVSRGVEWCGIYPTIRALTSEIFPEFYHNEKVWDKRTFALRCLMILENCSYHPLFESFTIFIAKGNRNIVEFAKSSDSDILLVRNQSRKIANFLPNYVQDSSLINPLEWESIKIIRRSF